VASVASVAGQAGPAGPTGQLSYSGGVAKVIGLVMSRGCNTSVKRISNEGCVVYNARKSGSRGFSGWRAAFWAMWMRPESFFSRRENPGADQRARLPGTSIVGVALSASIQL
jgi:hypothetical protein